MIQPRLVGGEIVFRFKLLTRQVVESPHAFISVGERGEKSEGCKK